MLNGENGEMVKKWWNGNGNGEMLNATVEMGNRPFQFSFFPPFSHLKVHLNAYKFPF